MKRLLFLILIMSLAGCAANEQFENYNFNGSSPLTLSLSNHPHGYEKSSCFSCHLPQNIHQVDRLGDPSFQFAKALVEQNGLQSCEGCHGKNGVTP